MGLLNDSLAEDQQVLSLIVDAVAGLWNEAGGPKLHGVRLSINRSNVAICCRYGGEILNNHFPKPPGVFKRLGTALVMARLYPLFNLDWKRPDDRWDSRVLALIIPPILRTMEINVSLDPKQAHWVNLDSWHDFPSPHYKLEFLRLLEDINDRGIPHPRDWSELHSAYIARLALAISLIMESCYYGNEGLPRKPAAHHIRQKGPCLHMPTLDLTHVSYDGFIWDYYQNR